MTFPRTAMLRTVAGPTIRRRQLGIELRRLRDAAGSTREQAALALGCSPVKVTYMEIGRNTPNKPELIVLLQFYGADKEHLDTLEEIRQEASKRGWWSTARLPEWLAGYVGLEYDAVSMRTLDVEVIPGLLQTEQYARHIHHAGGHLSKKEVEQRVAARLQRQQRLAVPDGGLQLSVVMSEGALHRCARQRDVGPGQLAHLLDQAQRPNIDLRVLPYSVGLVGTAGPFILLKFPEGLLPEVAFQEHAIGGHLIDDESAVAWLSRIHDGLRDQALGCDESLATISEFIDADARYGEAHR